MHEDSARRLGTEVGRLREDFVTPVPAVRQIGLAPSEQIVRARQVRLKIKND
jgi:hypothetical protein